MIGLKHIIIGACFVIGTVLIDFDHLTHCTFKEMVRGIFTNNIVCTGSGVPFMHQPIVYISITAFWLGYTIHMIADYVGN